MEGNGLERQKFNKVFLFIKITKVKSAMKYYNTKTKANPLYIT